MYIETAGAGVERLRCAMVPVFNHAGRRDWQMSVWEWRRWLMLALTLRRLGVVGTPGTGAGIEMVGIEKSRGKATLALRAVDYLQVVMALRQLGMTKRMRLVLTSKRSAEGSHPHRGWQ